MDLIVIWNSQWHVCHLMLFAFIHRYSSFVFVSFLLPNSNFLFHSTKWWPISVCELNVNVNCVRRLFIKFFFFISQKSVLDVYTVLLLLIHHSSSIIPRRRENLLPNSIAPDLFVSLWTQCTQFTIYNVHECTHTDTHTRPEPDHLRCESFTFIHNWKTIHHKTIQIHKLLMRAD